jgi:hemolysin III
MEHPIQRNPHRAQTMGEEIANSITHGFALIAALAGAPLLILAAVHHGGALTVVGVSIFAASMILLYVCSMTYHFLPYGEAKRLFEYLDHCAIYLLIAGTYTPFALIVLGGTLGWTLFGLIWSAALFGIGITLVPKFRRTKVRLILYLAMGWVIVFFLHPLCQHLSPDGLAWLVAGGIAYTVGIIFYVTNGPRYYHFIWHLFTVAGTTCHFFAVLWYVI